MSNKHRNTRRPLTMDFKARTISLMLSERLGGQVFVGPRVITAQGVTVPNLGWVPEKRAGEPGCDGAFTIAPEICVEFGSPGCLAEHLDQNRAAYFEAGAKEVWICGEDNCLTFYAAGGPLDRSGLRPDFPCRPFLIPGRSKYRPFVDDIRKWRRAGLTWALIAERLEQQKDFPGQASATNVCAFMRRYRRRRSAADVELETACPAAASRAPARALAVQPARTSSPSVEDLTRPAEESLGPLFKVVQPGRLL